MTESHGITIIATSPDDADFNMNRLINQIYTHIIKSTKKQANVSTKKSLIDNLSKRLLELELESNYSIKSKRLKWIVKNVLLIYKEWKTTQSKKKNDKNWKKTWNNVLFGVQRLYS